MTSVHPAYDPTTRSWFHEDLEAPTVRQLLALLRKRNRRATIADYYPCGAPPTVWPRDERPRVVLPPSYKPPQYAEKRIGDRSPPVSPPTPEPSVPDGPPAPPVADATVAAREGAHNRKYDPERILDLWDRGLSSTEIAEELGMPSRSVVADVLVRARRAGDPRAHLRPHVGNSEELRERVLSLWRDDRITLANVARLAGITPGRASGIVCRARAAGDARASRRDGR